MDYWTRISDTEYASTDDGYFIEIDDDGSVWATDSTGTRGGDMSEYEDEDDGLNPNVVKEDFPSVAAMLEAYELSGEGLPPELLEQSGPSL